MVHPTAIVIAALYLLLTAGLAVPIHAGQDRENSGDLVQTTRLLNRSVKFQGISRTGEISALYLDPATGLMPFGVLTFEALFGVVDKACILCIPWPDVQFDSRTKRFVTKGMKTDDVSCLTYNPDFHETIQASRAEKIFEYYGMDNLLRRRRDHTGSGYHGKVYDLVRLTNIPVYRRGVRVGRVERYFASLDSGMVRMVLIHRDGHAEETENFVLVPFALLKYDATEIAYHLSIEPSTLSKAARFDHFDDAYLSREAIAELYRTFGLEGYWE